MKITIKEPCHENWDNMSPNAQGAFCLACKKNVVDFSQKSLVEVKNFFTDLASVEKVCGRFKETQLKEMSLDHFLNEFMSWHFLKRAAVVCFMVIGSTLFSSCSSPPTQHVVGAMVVDTVVTKPIQTDTLIDEPMIIGEEAAVDTTKKQMHKGNVKVIKQQKPNAHVMGGPRVIENTVVVEKLLKGDVAVEKEK